MPDSLPSMTDAPENLGTLFKRHVGGGRIAAIEPGRDGARETTYAVLDRACDAVARGLKRRGLREGDRVAILSLNRIEYLEALFGSLRLGCVPVTVNVRLPADAVAHILADAGARLAFADADGARLVPAGLPVVDFDTGYRGFLDAGDFAAIRPRPRQVSMQPYTAGTTGRPKGVLLTHAGQVWAAQALTEGRRIEAHERILISAPFFHKNAIVAIKTALLPGATLVILPRFDARASIAAIAEHRVTMLTGVPTMMHLILAELEKTAGVDTRSVATISIGSAPASPALLEALARAFPRAAVRLNYGSTEGGPISHGWFHPLGLVRPPGSIGYPLPGCELRFVGGPSDKEGELWVRNPGVALGYHNLAQETAARFEDGWYKTGDILRQDENGWCHVLGRVDDMFISGGENVYPAEVETLLERHPDIAQAVVLPFASDIKGEVPFAFVVARQGAALDEAQVKAFALAHGPAYAHPRRVFFVARIPLSGTNKIDRAALRALAAHDSPQPKEEARG